MKAMSGVDHRRLQKKGQQIDSNVVVIFIRNFLGREAKEGKTLHVIYSFTALAANDRAVKQGF
eukprot:scaffold128322_cov14-Tisochrysis_lutea.AAC.1